MMLREQVYAHAVMLAGEPEERQRELLRGMCGAAVSSLTARLREGVTAEDCGEDFLMAAGFLALAAMNEAANAPEEFKAGDLTVKRGGGSAASQCLYTQAEMMIAPYLEDRFAFLGV